MSTTRRRILSGTVGAASLGLLPGTASSRPAAPAPARGVEGQRRADLGNGRFLNPVFAGDRPDPTVLKDGRDYYASFSSFDYYPGITLWHSRDLVNWAPIGPALRQPLGAIYALDLVKHQGRYFIYIPAANLPGAPNASVGGKRRPTLSLYVIHADRIDGPWSDPIEMGIYGRIDPGHVVGEDGRRYLYVDDGYIVPLSDDGLRATDKPQKVYDGWRYPRDWIDEGFALEGPKLMKRGDWFYMFSAQGGTAGPPTSHMVVVARSRSVKGPWENAPGNPLVHTRSIDEAWWSRGHGTPVEGPDGRWWLAHHGYENGYRSLGRQMLLSPFLWGADGWPKSIADDIAVPLRMPMARVADHGIALSGPFSPAKLGMAMAFYAPREDYLSRLTFPDGALALAASGTGIADCSPLTFNTGDHRYQMSVEVVLSGGAEAGLLLFYDGKLFCGVGAHEQRLHRYKLGKEMAYPPTDLKAFGSRFFLKVINDRQTASFYLSGDGAAWSRVVSLDVTGYNHNMAGGFLSLRPALYASGTGSATFGSVRYAAL